MASATLKYDDKELKIGEGVTTLGRTPENTVSFPGNSGISRYHAEIEFRDGRFWLRDLGSSNGTAVNGVRIKDEIGLTDGDFITLGNSVIIEFLEDEISENAAKESVSEETSPVNQTSSAQTPGKNTKTSVALGVTGAICGLAVVFAAAAVLVSFYGDDSSCNAAARFLNPKDGMTISEETEVKIEVSNAECVDRVVVVLQNKELVSFTTSPYSFMLDPKNHADLADGGLYPLEIILEDAEGKLIGKRTGISLEFSTREIAPPTPTEIVANSPTPTPISGGKQLSVIETKDLIAAIVRNLSGNAEYNISNPEFLTRVQRKTAEYAAEGYFQRATAYRAVINQAFISEKNLDASLAYISAMSRSKFNPASQGANHGLWQMSDDFAIQNAYNVICSNFNLTDAAQECAAKVAASYLRNLVDTFDGDIVYAVAAFGKTPGEANNFKMSLPVDRKEFWKIITSEEMRENVVNFFAAAIVAENPQKFKLKNDRPISELYPPVSTK